MTESAFHPQTSAPVAAVEARLGVAFLPVSRRVADTLLSPGVTRKLAQPYARIGDGVVNLLAVLATRHVSDPVYPRIHDNSALSAALRGMVGDLAWR